MNKESVHNLRSCSFLVDYLYFFDEFSGLDFCFLTSLIGSSFFSRNFVEVLDVQSLICGGFNKFCRIK